MTWNPGFRHERTFLNSTAIWSLIKSSCLLHVLQNHGIFCLMYSACRFPVVRLLTVVYFSVCNVCWAAAWGMVGFLWGRKEPCPSIETAVEMLRDWHCQMWSCWCLVYAQRGQGCSYVFTPAWHGCCLLPSGLPWSCSKAHAQVQT